MTREQFKRALVAAFGKGWLVPASEALGIHYSKLQRMASGREMLYPDTADMLKQAMRVRIGEIDALLRELGDGE